MAGDQATDERSATPSDVECRSQPWSDAHLDAVPVPVLVVGLDGAILAANQGARRLLGRDEVGLLSAPLGEVAPWLRSLLPPTGGAPGLENRERSLVIAPGVATGVGMLARVRPATTDGVPSLVITLVGEGNASMDPIGADRLDGDLELMVRVVTRDLTSPLRTIESLLSFVLDDSADQLVERSRHHVLQARRRARRLLDMIDDLATYLTLDGAGTRAAVDLGRMFQEQIDRHVPPEFFTIVAPDDLPVVRAHAPSVELVLRQVIRNVIRHHDRPTGTISVDWSRSGAWDVVTVSDDGPGIDPRHHHRILDPFATVDPPDRDTLDSSTGMGLALVARAMEAMGGTVDIRSDGRRGTSVILSWPRVTPDGGPAPSDPPPAGAPPAERCSS